MSIEGLPVADGIGRPRVERAGVVGLGMIGSSWVALMLAQGIDVVGYDPCQDAEARVHADLEQQKPALDALGLLRSRPGQFTHAASLEAAVRDADVVQENSPESLEVKRAVIGAISEATPDEVIIASSTSGLTPSEFACEACRPERIIVGHPFLPVTIIPLIEVLGGRHTHPAATDWASRFYRGLGKTPVVLRREVPGLLANRFQVVVLNEALSLIEQGVATPEEIETAFIEGPGLRWALFGPLSLLALASGDKGVRESWKRCEDNHHRALQSQKPLVNADSVIERVDEASNGLPALHDPEAATAARDRALVALLALRRNIPHNGLSPADTKERDQTRPRTGDER